MTFRKSKTVVIRSFVLFLVEVQSKFTKLPTSQAVYSLFDPWFIQVDCVQRHRQEVGTLPFVIKLVTSVGRYCIKSGSLFTI